MRQVLGEGFSHRMPDRVEDRLDIDVIVTDIEGDGYSLQVAGRKIIIVKRTANWFRQNFSIAHELGHFSSDSLCDKTLGESDPAEAAANAFAAELLMPAAQLASINWTNVELPILAEQLWHWGVSTKAVAVRLESLKHCPSQGVSDALTANTAAFLRKHWFAPLGPDQITMRRERSSQRRFPTELINRLDEIVVLGTAPKESLAYALGIKVDELEVEPPLLADPEVDAQLLDGLL